MRALFKTVHELKVGDPVKMAGVTIGGVTRIVLTNSMAEVTMNLNREADVRTDCKARVSFAGLMAQNFVSLDFGSPDSPRAADGIVLQSVEQPDLES